MPLPRITYKRQFVQGILIVAALLFPFMTISGNPFLRMDITRMTLFVAGLPIRIDQFYLVLLVVLLCTLSFLLLTAVLGRVWCGWLCPQTVFNDLMEVVTRRFKSKNPSLVSSFIEHLSALNIATLIAFILLCWFMSPGQVIAGLANFHEHLVLLVAFSTLTVFGYLNLIIVKRSFCHSYCPYGRFQTALMDAGTLNLSFIEETRDLCLRCNACVRTCPMGIDIRNGFQVECIGCGRCIDACRSVMEKRPDGIGLIGYRFGIVKGTKFKLGNITTVLLVMTIVLISGLVWGVLSRNQTAFAIQRVATTEQRHLPDGSIAQPWRAIIGNRSETQQKYSIRVVGEQSGDIELIGQTHDIEVAANQHREVIFMIHVAKNAKPHGKVQLELLLGNQPSATVTVTP